MKLQENFTPTFTQKKKKWIMWFLHFISLAKFGFVSCNVKSLFSTRSQKASSVACLVSSRERRRRRSEERAKKGETERKRLRLEEKEDERRVGGRESRTEEEVQSESREEERNCERKGRENGLWEEGEGRGREGLQMNERGKDEEGNAAVGGWAVKVTQH